MDARRQTIAFFAAFAQSEHRMVIVRGTAFDQKAWALCKSREALTIRIAKIFVLQVRQNSSRSLILEADTAAHLPDDLASQIKPDDHYLVRAQLSVPGTILITTDTPLREILAHHGLLSMTREDFLFNYFHIK